MAKENLMVRSLKIFEDRDYRVSKVKIIDMFTKKGHVECVVLMSRVEK